MKPIKLLYLFISAILLANCNPNVSQNESAMQMNFQTSDGDYFPVELDITPKSDSLWIFTFYNGREEITIETSPSEDEIAFSMPVFESYFELSKSDQNDWTGHYYDPSRGEGYRIPVHTSTRTERWTNSAAPENETYAFHYGENLEFSGYAFLHLENGQLRGTIRSEIGDYRYLSGWLIERDFNLQTFDGSHVYHWSGQEGTDGLIRGTFYSGNHFSTPFEFRPVENVSFEDADELTQVVSPIEFKLPLSLSDSIHFPSDEYEGKVVLIQVLGSWCPNCMDETRFIANDLFPEFNEKGLEIIGIAFERYRDSEKNFAAIEKMKRDLQVNYPIALGGFADKREAGEVLPFLSEVISFPTTILIDQNGNIVRVHTGFDGPGTEEPYENYVRETKALINNLLTQ